MIRVAPSFRSRLPYETKVRVQVRERVQVLILLYSVTFLPPFRLFENSTKKGDNTHFKESVFHNFMFILSVYGPYLTTKLRLRT